MCTAPDIQKCIVFCLCLCMIPMAVFWGPIDWPCFALLLRSDTRDLRFPLRIYLLHGWKDSLAFIFGVRSFNQRSAEDDELSLSGGSMCYSVDLEGGVCLVNSGLNSLFIHCCH